jgi:acylphosphatase
MESPIETKCRRFRVTGRVQGVFFRDSTREEARRLGLTGYANNMPDGSVEVLACGTDAALDKLAAWLQKGPPMASVAAVEASEAQYVEFGKFRIG